MNVVNSPILVKQSVIILKSLKKDVFGKHLQILNGEYVGKGDVRELNFKGFYLIKTLLDKQKNCFASVNMYYLE